MFRINYKIIEEDFKEIEFITEEKIHYNFLVGNVSFFSFNTKIEMDWEWIPLLDIAYGLKMIVDKIKIDDSANEFFEFTENSETLEISKTGKQLKIVASFSPVAVETLFVDFESAAYDFHFHISKYILSNIFCEPPPILQKYLSLEL